LTSSTCEGGGENRDTKDFGDGEIIEGTGWGRKSDRGSALPRKQNTLKHDNYYKYKTKGRPQTSHKERGFIRGGRGRY